MPAERTSPCSIRKCSIAKPTSTPMARCHGASSSPWPELNHCEKAMGQFASVREARGRRGAGHAVHRLQLLVRVSAFLGLGPGAVSHGKGAKNAGDVPD